MKEKTYQIMKGVASGAAGLLAGIATKYLLDVVTASLIPGGNTIKEIVIRTGVAIAKTTVAGAVGVKTAEDMADTMDRTKQASDKVINAIKGRAE